MIFTPEQLAKAKAAKSAEELIALKRKCNEISAKVSFGVMIPNELQQKPSTILNRVFCYNV